MNDSAGLLALPRILDAGCIETYASSAEEATNGQIAAAMTAAVWRFKGRFAVTRDVDTSVTDAVVAWCRVHRHSNQ